MPSRGLGLIGIVVIKSDQNGIESRCSAQSSIEVERIKSDQNGIESTC